MDLTQFDTSDEEIQESGDYVGGVFTHPNGEYTMRIDAAYLGQSQGGANSLTLHFSEVEGNRQHRETLWITSGQAKGQKNYYINQKGEKHFLPGMETANQLCLIVTGKKLAQQAHDNKMVSIWNYEQRKEVPTEVPVLTDLVGEEVRLVLGKIRENKTQKVDGEYIDTNEAREFNEIVKFVTPNGRTVTEARAEMEEAEWLPKWLDRFEGKDYFRDKFKEVEGAAVNTASAQAAADSSEEVANVFA